MWNFITLFLIMFGVPGGAYAEIEPVAFPKTFSDIPLDDRIVVLTTGYRPFFDKSVYQELNVVPGEEAYTDAMVADMMAEWERELNTPEPFPVVPPGLAGGGQSYVTDDEQPSLLGTGGENNGSIYYSGMTIGGGPVVENNYVTGGSCYPAAKDANFVNKILTTGKYERISPAFEKALITVFRKEGKCGTIKNDSGGYTCFGVTSRYYPQVKNPGFSRADAEEIYYNNYWKNHHLDRLPDVISGDIFLAGMGSGPQSAIKQFSNFLGIKSTLYINEEMIKAVNNYNGDIHNRWLDYRAKYLDKVARDTYNGTVTQGYRNGIILKRKNGCHVRPAPGEVLTR